MLCFFFFLKSCPVSSLTVNDARSHFWSTRMMMRWINFSGTSYQSFVQNFFSYCRTITMIFSPHTIWKTFLSIIIVLPVAHWRSNRIFLISFIPPPKKLFSFFFFYFFYCENLVRCGWECRPVCRMWSIARACVGLLKLMIVFTLPASSVMCECVWVCEWEHAATSV